MSVFRNTPRPGDKDPEPNTRLGESLLSRPDLPPRQDASNGYESPAPIEEPRTSFGAPMPERDTRLGPTSAEKCANVIAAGSKWNGTLNIDDSVRIEGQFTGEVVAKGTVHISEGARVEAKIRSGFVVVSGSFKGEVRCDERLELMPKSRLEGDIVTKTLTMHEGAIIDGSIQMTAAKNQPQERNRDDEVSEPSRSESRNNNAKALT
jgi:cytoskeletal protein CcmA (bactofilin family)